MYEVSKAEYEQLSGKVEQRSTNHQNHTNILAQQKFDYEES